MTGIGICAVDRYQKALREYWEARLKIEKLIKDTYEQAEKNWLDIPDEWRIGLMSPALFIHQNQKKA